MHSLVKTFLTLFWINSVIRGFVFKFYAYLICPTCQGHVSPFTVPNIDLYCTYIYHSLIELSRKHTCFEKEL
jgi:hypothetical protein